MAKQVMRRTAADNVYLHRDFHGALSTGIEYLHRRFGEQAVRDYLHQFGATYYSDVTAGLRERGLVAMKEHLERIYAIEGGRIRLTCSEDELVLDVEASPAIMHMREHGYHVAGLFGETMKSVFEGICEETPFAVEVLEYDPATGRSRVRFYRRGA